MGRGSMVGRCGLAAALLVGTGLVGSGLTGPALADAKVVTSILPLHSLVAGVMEGLGEPTLLLEGGASPHSYSLKPSEARALADADLVFWIGEGLETFLEKPLESLAGAARVVEVAELAGIEAHEIREGGIWDAHGHDEDDHEDHDGQEGYGEHEGHADPHLWLDPHNADHIVRAAVQLLGEADPANADRYRANGKAVLGRLATLNGELERLLRPVEARPFVVFHDAYQYLEKRYRLAPAGSITLSPDRAPGAKRLYEIRGKLIELAAACVFSEPQFEPALVRTVIEGTSAKTAELDPLGAGLVPGPEAYFELLRGLAGSLSACLTPAS